LELEGVFYHFCRHLFGGLGGGGGGGGGGGETPEVRLCVLEDYCGELRDLGGGGGGGGGGVYRGVARERVRLKEGVDGVVEVSGAVEVVVRDEREMVGAMESAMRVRTVCATAMNASSSRGSLVVRVLVGRSVVSFVDMAGSERVGKCSGGQLLRESTKINLSLSAMGNVISALSSPLTKHIPLRDSHLTRLLGSVFCPSSSQPPAVLAFLGVLSPAEACRDESISTVRWVHRLLSVGRQEVAIIHTQ
jgi:kinesin family protein 3/17